ncbi:MAG TPA: ATP-binding protein [Bacteriovoracaceae bacterium]|nr:ATP-binding protein [Bacteriovoracaceae bacterium]
MNLIHRTINSGVTPDLNPVFAKRIILTNQLGLVFGVYMSISAILFFYFNLYMLTALAIFFAMTELSWPVWNFFGHYKISRVGLLITSNLLGFITSILLPDTGYNRGFFVMAGVPLLLFGLREKRIIFAGLVMAIVLYPFSEWAQYHTPSMINGLILDGWAKDVVFFSTGMFYLTLVFLMFLFISTENARAEEKLENALINLEEQKSRAFSSAKFAALGEMASGIGHEINNPMMSIHLTAELLKRTMTNPDTNKDATIQKLDNILSLVGRVDRIITAMRTFSRDAGNDSPRKEPLVKIIEDTLSLCAENFKQHSIEMLINYPTEEIEVNCRGVQISQVVVNLLNNAFDAIETLPEKWIKLDIFRDNDKVMITVGDSGCSIPPEDKEKIFLPFFTTKDIGKGTGLGLSLSRKIIEDHGGRMFLDPIASTTKFVIELPG